MTVKELFEMSNAPLEIKSGYNGKILCKKYTHIKHPELSEREVLNIWAEIRIAGASSYNCIARPVICVFVSGKTEYEQSLKTEARP